MGYGSRARSFAAPGMTKELIPRELPELRPGLGRALEHRLPRHLVRLLQEFLALLGTEVDRLDTRLGLLLALGGDDGDVLRVEPLEPERRIIEHLALGVGEAFPGVEIDQHVHLDAVERRLEAILGHLFPAEIEDARHLPAVTVDDA